MRDCILHLADLHLGAPVWCKCRELLPSIAEKLEAARDGILDSLVGWIESSGSRVGLVLIAGDLFHCHAPEDRVVNQTRQAIARIARVVPVITVPGNHDEYSYPKCVYREPSWPGRLVTETQPTQVWDGELDGGVRVAVTSVAYEAGKLPPGGEVQFPRRDGGTLDVALVHGTLRDRFQGVLVEGERCFLVSHQQVAEAGYRYLALGHIHARSHWELGPCTALYPGPPVDTSPSRSGSGSVTLVETAGSQTRIAEASEPALIGLQWHRIPLKLDPEQTVSEVAQRLGAELPQADHLISVVRLSGQAGQEDFADRLEQTLREQGRVALVESEDLRLAEPVDFEALLQEQSLEGEFARCWQQWRDSARPDDLDLDANLVLREALAALKRKT